MSIKQSVTLDELIEFLNELIEVDRSAMEALAVNRVRCNRAMAEHPSVQVLTQDDEHHIGLIGILNGIFGTFDDGWGPITWTFDENNLLRVEKTIRPKRNDCAAGVSVG